MYLFIQKSKTIYLLLAIFFIPLSLYAHNGDICYEKEQIEKINNFSICMDIGGINCRNIIPIKNQAQNRLENVNVYLTKEGGFNGAALENCNVKDGKGSCDKTGEIEVGPLAFNESYHYNLNSIADSDSNDTRYTYIESTASVDFIGSTGSFVFDGGV
jgi:hypothetical protein